MKKFLFLFTLISTTCLFSQDFRYGKVSVEELEETQHPIEPEADAAILYKEIKTDFDYSTDEGFYMVTEVFERIKIYNDKGIEWATKEIGLYKSGAKKEEIKYDKGVTYNLENGKITSDKLKKKAAFSLEISEYKTLEKYTFPNVKAGSIIEFSYTVTSPFVTDIDTYNLQYKIPVNEINLTFAPINYFNYKIHQKGAVPINLSKKITTKKINYNYSGAQRRTMDASSGSGINTINVDLENFIIQQSNVPSLTPEPYSGSLENYRSSVKFELAYFQYPGSMVENFTLDWNGVAKRIYESSSFGNELNKTGYFKKDLNELLANTTTPNDKLITVYEYVKNYMTWNSYLGEYSQTGLAKAYREKVGNIADINLMLTSMLNYAGIKSYPVLLSTKSNGIPLFPTINGFNYVIVASTLENGNLILLDASDKFLTPNTLRPETMNWQGRLIKNDGTSQWVSLNNPSASLQNTMLNIEIQENNAITGASRTQYTEHLALKYRKKYYNVDHESIIKNIEGNSGVEISDFEVKNLSNPYENVMESYSINTTNQSEKIGNKIYFSPLFFLTETENPFKKDERIFPIDFSYPWEYRYMVNIKIPDGYTVESVPENMNVATPNKIAEFKYLVNTQGNQLQLSIQQTVNQSMVKTQLYPDIKGIFQLMIDKLNEKIVLVKS